MKAIRIFVRNIGSALKSISRNISLSAASIICTTITLLIVGIAMVVTSNINNFTKDLENTLSIIVYVDKDASEEDLTTIKSKMLEIKNIKSDEIILKDKEKLKEETLAKTDENNEADEVKTYLTNINIVLEDTPFKLGYRAANEALLYVSAARKFNPNADLNTTLDEFTLMKILSRIEGDKRSIGGLLVELQNVITSDYPQSNKKLIKMADTLKDKQFVSYWT